MKTNLRDYSENELSLWVFNDEGLYKMRRKSYFLRELSEFFEFTDEQLKVLKQDLTDDEDN